jgi:GT2 family glycosyltransferase
MSAVTTSNLRSRGVAAGAGAATARGLSEPSRPSAEDGEPPLAPGPAAGYAPLVLTGMHRSGTSLAASILRSAGVAMGERLMAPHESNPQGFFEDLDFVELHKEALARKGLHPDGWDARPIDALGGALSARALDLAGRKSAQVPWGWKDPRTVLLLSFWARVLPASRFVFLFRSPWDVLDSLFRRGDAAVLDQPGRMAEIWSAYNRRILRFMDREPGRGLLFDADAVAEDPGGFVHAVAERFGLDLAPPDPTLFHPELYRRQGGGAARRAVFSRLHPSEMKLLASLAERAHPLGTMPRPAAETASLPDASEAFLAEWAASRSKARTGAGEPAAPARTEAEPPPALSSVAVQAFAPRAGEYSEDQSITQTVQDDGRTRDLAFLLPYDASAPLRIDIGHSINLVEVRRISARMVGEDQTEAHDWSGAALSVAPVRLANSIRLEGDPEEGLQILSLGDDAQLYLDVRTALPPPAECRLELTVAVWTLASAARDPRLAGWLAALGRKMEEAEGALRLSERHVAALSSQLEESGPREEGAQSLPARVREIDSLRESLREAAKRSSDDAARLDELQRTVQARADELRRVQAQLAAEETARRGFLDGLGRLATELADVHRDLASARAEAIRLSVEMADARARAERAESESARLSSILDEARSEAGRAASQLSQLRAESERDLSRARDAERVDKEVSAWRTRAQRDAELLWEALRESERLQRSLHEAEQRAEQSELRAKELEAAEGRARELEAALATQAEEILALRPRLASQEASRAGALENLQGRTRTLQAAEAELWKLGGEPLRRARRLLLAPVVLWRIWNRHPGVRRRAGWRALTRIARSWDLQLSALRRSDLFDAAHYEATGADVKALGVDGPLHYLLVGASEGRNPHALFDTRYYLERNRDAAASGLNPLVHYLRSGGMEGRDPHPLFDSGHYRSGLEPEAATLNPLLHYLRVGALEGRDPHPLFDTSFYLEANPDVAAAGKDPLVHYLERGAREGRNPNPWFDTSFYLGAHPEVAASGQNPLVHYVTSGASSGLDPSPRFSTAFYLLAYPDVAAAGINPLAHFLSSGLAQGRNPTPAHGGPSGSPAVAESAPAPAGIEASKLEARRADIERSRQAYRDVLLEARARRADRIARLRTAPPRLIAFSGDLGAQTAAICFESHASPEVTIIVPAWNGVRFTAECLESIARFTEGVAYEVIVFDNGSTDDTPRLLPRIPNLVYLRSEENLGFGVGCNQAAASARGKYLVFLNSDAQVTPGWLGTLLDAGRGDSTVGAVGPKVVFPDGRLQEAGAGIRSDGTSTLIGLFDDPDAPSFNRLREVDYASGACLLIDTALFREVGGFDPDFAPAYCEDVDLCLRLRARGLKTLYNPAAVVVHHLSASANAMDSSFKVRCVTRHQQLLAERHQEQIDELNRVRLLAFYLPQFHPIPENDLWWGRGFTEWHNVARARPNFAGHDQPRLPSDLGFYDLRLRESYLHQVELAERYGIHGLCIYYYWFAGKRLLERPLERLLEDPSLTFPFCVAWANENWTRAWDGREAEVLLGQAHDDADDRRVIHDLMRYFDHPSYIRINGRPVFLVYRVSLFPNIRRTVDIWRNECRRRGKDVYLVMVESCEQAGQPTSPFSLGFDASVEFPPHEIGTSIPVPGPLTNPSFRGTVYDYEKAALAYMARPQPGYTRFRTVMPGWDNTARRQDTSDVFVGSSPGAYQAWLEWVLRQTREHNAGDERIVFINAWNEWAEANYLEPDTRWGHAYLEATKSALQAVGRDFWP